MIETLAVFLFLSVVFICTTILALKILDLQAKRKRIKMITQLIGLAIAEFGKEMNKE